MKIGLVGVAKNEGRVVSEWIAYHLALGFDAAIIYDNGSTDDTAEKVRLAAKEVDARVTPWTRYSGNWQITALDHAAASLRDEFDWIAFFDLDEFLDCGTFGNIHELIRTAGTGAAIALNWAVFGSNGQVAHPPRMLTQTYTRRSHPNFAPNRHIKSIVRMSSYVRCINSHRFDVDGDYMDAWGHPLVSDGGALVDVLIDKGAPKLNHFFVKSKEEWAAKVARGYKSAGYRTMEEFDIYDRNEVQDLSSEVVGRQALRRYRFLRREVRASKPPPLWLAQLGWRRNELQLLRPQPAPGAPPPTR